MLRYGVCLLCICASCQATQNILATTAGSELRLMDQTYGLKLTRMHLIAEGHNNHQERGRKRGVERGLRGVLSCAILC